MNTIVTVKFDTTSESEYEKFKSNRLLSILYAVCTIIQFLPHYSRLNILAAALYGAMAGVCIYKSFDNYRRYVNINHYLGSLKHGKEENAAPAIDAKELEELKKITGME